MPLISRSTISFNQDNLKFLVFFIIPILLSIYLIPKFINPEIINNLLINFKIGLLSKKYCQIQPIYCSILLNDNDKYGGGGGGGDPNQLKRIQFKYFELIYVVHKWIYNIDQFIIHKLILLWPIKKIIGSIMIIIMMRNNNNNNNNNNSGGGGGFGGEQYMEEIWEKWIEIIQIILAVINSMIYHLIWGLIVSRMYVFFIFGTLITVFEPWERLIDPLMSVLSTNNVY